MQSAQPLRYRAYRHSHGRVSIADVELSLSQLEQQHRHVLLVQPRYVGVCSADIRELRGERPGRSDFGHEVVGTVLQSTHEEFSRGDAVVVNPFIKLARETAFAQAMYLAGADELIAVALIKVPTTAMQFSIAEPLACVIHAARKSLLASEGPVLVLGSGFFGCMLYGYLESRNVPVTLANRSPDRLAELDKLLPGLNIAANLESLAGKFAAVFLMQARLTGEDIKAAGRFVREQGEIIPFGAVDRHRDPQLHAIRNQQKRMLTCDDSKSFYLQGTLDASSEDLREAVSVLADPKFVQRVSPIFAQLLTFEEGADHLTRRVLEPRSFLKYVIDIQG